MTLATIVSFYLLSLGSPSSGLAADVGVFAMLQIDQQPSTASSASQPPSQSQNTTPAQPAPSPNNPAPNSPTQATPSPKRPRHRKKTAPCSNSPTALNPAVDTNTGSSVAGSANVSGPLKPCPPAKKVVHNGGSDEPKIQLSGGTDAEHAAQQGSTEQLTLATEENLKQIAGRQLSPSQQEMVNQIKEFMQQSKTAVAAGEVQRGHSLALKARLLSDELVKP